jgi:hypothetical protein
MYGIDRRTVRRWLVHAEIPLRTDKEVVNLLTRHPPIEASVLRDLYWASNLSLEGVGLRLGAGATWVRNQILGADIPLKPSWRQKFSKTHFSGKPIERAYLLGFRAGALACSERTKW